VVQLQFTQRHICFGAPIAAIIHQPRLEASAEHHDRRHHDRQHHDRQHHDRQHHDRQHHDRQHHDRQPPAPRANGALSSTRSPRYGGPRSQRPQQHRAAPLTTKSAFAAFDHDARIRYRCRGSAVAATTFR
jgi:hypothetical protein